MWESLKEKIAECKCNENFMLDFIGNTSQIPCTEEICLIKWYNTNKELYDEDSLENLEFTSLHENIENSLQKIENIKNHKHFNSIILHNLNIRNYENITNELIKNENITNVNFYAFSKNYLKFIKCINLSKDNKKSINFTKIDVFKIVFSDKYIDKTIHNFLDKLLLDPVNYNEHDKQNFIIILLYSYLYALNLNLPIKKQIYSKLKNNIFLLKSDTKFNIFFTKDYNIDKYIITQKNFENLHEESTFLNFFYQDYLTKHNVEKETFLNFLNRINKVILNIEKRYLLHFVKRVFLLHTVLYNSIDDLQVYKTVIDFFKKKVCKFDSENIKECILNFYITLINKIGQIEVYNMVIDHIVNNLDNFMKLEHFIFKFNFLQVRTWAQFLLFIEENRDSFNNLTYALELLFYSSEYVFTDSFESVCNLINIYLSIHSILKLDHLFKFIRSYFKHLKKLFEIIYSKLVNNLDLNNILDYYNLNSDIISKVILTLQRYAVLCNEDLKKDKKKGSRKSSAELLFHSFVNVIYKIEDILVNLYGNKVKATKKRSFVVKENNQTYFVYNK